MSTIERFESFRALHRADKPFFLPNAWDFGSAAFLAAAGHLAIGTTSLGVAAVVGKPDATGATMSETLALARLTASLPALITVDIEGGFSEIPEVVAELAEQLSTAGAVGVNLEDGLASGQLQSLDTQLAKIAAIKARVPQLFVNARTDAYWLAGSCPDPRAESLLRGQSFVDAGADGFFVPGTMGTDVIAELAASVPVPLNVLHRPGVFTPEVVSGLGVARVSSGSLLYRLALGAMLDGGYELNPRLPRPDRTGPPSYAEVQAQLPPS